MVIGSLLMDGGRRSYGSAAPRVLPSEHDGCPAGDHLSASEGTSGRPLPRQEVRMEEAKREALNERVTFRSSEQACVRDLL